MARRYRRPIPRPTLDGDPARVDFPLNGRAVVRTLDGRRQTTVDRAQARDIMAAGGAFQSPAFARPGKGPARAQVSA
jgi:hypothetical protein